MKKLFFKFFVISIILSINYNIFASNFLYTKDKKTAESSISTNAFSPTFNFQSKSQILIEPVSGEILYANNEHEKLLPASVTKIMTLLLLMEKIDNGEISYSDTITCSSNASKMGGSQIWFKEGEKLTIDEALKAICVVSANDVTVAIAEFLGGSEENFVSMMNKKALELGMNDTHFMNSHGIDEENHYTSAYDIALMGKELINKHPDILKYTSIWMDTLRDGTFSLSSTNKLIRFYEGATGLKTGSTSKALFNLCGTATRNNTTFLTVIMKAPTSDIRLEETKQLLDYAFANYENKILTSKDTLVEEISINKNITKKAQVYIKDTTSILQKKGENIKTTESITYNENLILPLEENSVIGKMKIYDENTNNVIKEVDLIIKNNLERSNFSDYLKKVANLVMLKDTN